MSCPSDLSEGRWQKIAPFFEWPDPRYGYGVPPGRTA